MNEPRLTTRQVADVLGVSPATVLRRWRAGELPGFRLGSNVLRFSRAELDEWLQAHHSGFSRGTSCFQARPLGRRAGSRVPCWQR